MKNTGILKLVAVIPFLIWSCNKTSFAPEEVSVPEVATDPWTVIALPTTPGNGGPATLTAGNGETKSQLNIVSSSYAKVVWTTGDSFRMCAYTNGDATSSQSIYSTTSGGGETAEFSTGAAPASGKANYYSFYPASAYNNWSTYGSGDDFIVGLRFPSTQVADPGKLAEGANLSFARSSSSTEKLNFSNVPSIIKFRLSGTIVSSIKKVTFIGTGDVAGDLVFKPNGSYLDLLPGVHFEGDLTSRRVSLTLTGKASFATDTDYFIALLPSAQDSFAMVFENEDGSSKITRLSSKVLQLDRSKITDFGTINLGSSFDDNSMEPVLWSTHTTSKYATIAVIPDGYTMDKMDQYVTDASAGLDALFKTEPYKSYKDYFNVWILKVASNESGARISDGTLEQQNRDCFFQSSWKAEKYDDMHANDNRVFQFVQDNCPDIINGTHEIKDVPILMIINDTRFGGIAWNYSDGSTYCMVPKSRNGDPLSWNYPAQEAASVNATRATPLHTVTDDEKSALGGTNVGSWHNTLTHEFGGHSIGKLGDEYWYPDQDDKAAVEAIAQHTWPVPMFLNVSAKPAQENTPWAGLFNSTIQSKMQTRCTALSIPNYYSQRIDVFQGADVSTFNRWRSEKVSCMIDNRFYFSTWQRYLIVNRIRTLAGLSEFTISDFLDNDDPRDPKRDGVSSPVMRPVGVSDIVPPRPAPMLPPPRYVDKPAL